MRYATFLFLFFTFNGFYSQTPCLNDFAGPFECNEIDLLSQIPLSIMNSVKANDSWGWTDPLDGKEYALVCLNEATAFVDISDPILPIYLGQLPGESNQHTTWRDVKTYNNYAFIVSEDEDHGMQVFDLTKLRDVTNPPVIFSKDAYYDDFGRAHNIAINESTGYAYVLGSTTFMGGPHIVNIQDPLNPVFAGGSAENLYCHDAQIVVYNGPDPDYQGKEILFGSNETEVVIQDVTDKTNITTIATVTYNNFDYTHQGWLTEDLRYFLLGDERDEINSGVNSRTIIFDMIDLDNPEFHFSYEGPSGATDHNGYVKGNYFYLANNAAGLRIIDIRNIANEVMTEVAFFDTYPDNNLSGFNGSWSMYPYFESGTIIISDRAEGLLVVRPKKGTLSVSESALIQFSVFPNPVSNQLIVTTNTRRVEKISIVDITGRVVSAHSITPSQEATIDMSSLESGIYLVTINQTETFKIIKQ